MLPLGKTHDVPQFLLRQFAGADGFLWAYDAQKKRWFSAKPKDLAVEEYFYGAEPRPDQQFGLALWEEERKAQVTVCCGPAAEVGVRAGTFVTPRQL